MRIGYTVFEEEVGILTESGVDNVVLETNGRNALKVFMKFIEESQGNTVVLVNIYSVAPVFTLIQLYDVLSFIHENDYDIVFLEKGMDFPVSDKGYLDLLWFIVSNEKKAVINRTQRGIDKAREQGRFGGRPSLDEETINRIVKLHRDEKKSYREIAAICDVSLGSVHKYAPRNSK